MSKRKRDASKYAYAKSHRSSSGGESLEAIINRDYVQDFKLEFDSLKEMTLDIRHIDDLPLRSIELSERFSNIVKDPLLADIHSDVISSFLEFIREIKNTDIIPQLYEKVSNDLYDVQKTPGLEVFLNEFSILVQKECIELILTMSEANPDPEFNDEVTEFLIKMLDEDRDRVSAILVKDLDRLYKSLSEDNMFDIMGCINKGDLRGEYIRRFVSGATEIDDTKTEIDDTKTEIDDTKTEIDDTKTEIDSSDIVYFAETAERDNDFTVFDTKTTEENQSATSLSLGDLNTLSLNDLLKSLSIGCKMPERCGNNGVLAEEIVKRCKGSKEAQREVINFKSKEIGMNLFVSLYTSHFAGDPVAAANKIIDSLDHESVKSLLNEKLKEVNCTEIQESRVESLKKYLAAKFSSCDDHVATSSDSGDLSTLPLDKLLNNLSTGCKRSERCGNNGVLAEEIVKRCKGSKEAQREVINFKSKAIGMNLFVSLYTSHHGGGPIKAAKVIIDSLNPENTKVLFKKIKGLTEYTECRKLEKYLVEKLIHSNHWPIQDLTESDDDVSESTKLCDVMCIEEPQQAINLVGDDDSVSDS